MKADPIIQEIRRIRETRARTFQFDLRAMFDDLQRAEKEERWSKSDRQPRHKPATAVAEPPTVYGSA